MKKTLIYLIFLGLVSAGHSQEMIYMDPVKVEGVAFSMQLDPANNSINFTIPEKQAGEFHSNPLKFAETNFNIQQLIKDNDSKYDSYQVRFKSSKGHLLVQYDKKGEIVSTFQRFKNMNLPYETSHSIYRDYRDWDIVRTQLCSRFPKGRC